MLMIISIFSRAEAFCPEGWYCCTCEANGLKDCDLNDPLLNECDVNTECSRKIVTHDGDFQHMNDKEGRDFLPSQNAFG